MSQLGGIGRDALLHDVVRQLHHAVWELKEVGDGPVLGALGCGLSKLRLGASMALVHLVEERSGVRAVRFKDLVSDTGWRWARTEAEQVPIVRLWQQGADGRTSCVRATPRALDAATRRCGTQVGAALEVPFSHGVFGIYSEAQDAFDAGDRVCMEQLGLVLSALYHRAAAMHVLDMKEIELQHLQRLQLAGQLAAEVAHDLGGPMTVLLGECTLLLNRDLDPPITEAIQAIQRAAEQAHAVGNRLLDFVRGRAPDKAWVDCNHLVQDAIELVRRGFAKDDITLEADLGHNLPWILAHAGQVRQVVLNLLQNAREAVCQGGRQGWVRVRTYELSGRVILEVEDNGPGVAAEISEQIFEPFFTTKRDTNGTGLGLSVCAGIASEHGGDLRLEPRVMGACIRVELPVRQKSDPQTN